MPYLSCDNHPPKPIQAGQVGQMEQSPQKTEDGFGRLLAVHMLYTFIVSGMAVVVPLYLVDRQVDIAHIGLILSLGPLSFTLIRIFFAGVADDIGTKAISVLYGIANLIAIELYLLFVTPFGFVAATLLEGVRTAGFWAIARTDVLSTAGIGEVGPILARFSNLRQLADGLGRVAAGFIIAYLAFGGALAVMLALSLGLLALIVSSNGDGALGFRVGRSTFSHIFKRHTGRFWHNSLLQLLVWLPYNMLGGFLIPLYLISSLRLPYEQVGLILALISLASAAFALIFVRLGLSNRTLMLMMLFSVPALVLIPLLGAEGLPLLALVAIAFGCGNIVGEYILVDVVFRSRDVSADIGVLYAPLKAAEFLFLFFGGMVISAFGYAPLFYTLATSMALFVMVGGALIPPKSFLGALRLPAGRQD